ncbi:MAG: beta-lactamase/transpeptidase-like protein [Linnemannia gamsii]|nr:MAG: beta-lactamase/transpeptidase-like protein [Linnemannia gamsii]
MTQVRDPTPSVENVQKKPLHDLSAVLDKYRVEGGIKGMSVSILYKGDLIFAEGFGYRNDTDPFTKDTLMPIGSLTKAFTATAVGEVVAEGKMDWDTTPVNTYLPEFRLKDPVMTSQLTLADLLSHRTNLPNVSIRWIKAKESRLELIKLLRHADQSSRLTSNQNYSNTMYAVAGEAAAQVAGVSYEELVKTKVFQPLGLANTGFSQLALKQFDNYTMPYDAASFEDAQKGNFICGELDEFYLTDAPAGDIYSNVLDLARWGAAIMKDGEVDGKQVLNKESVAEVLTGRTFSTGVRRTPDFAPVKVYGLGWGIDAYKGYAKYGHMGQINGYNSSIAFYPDLDLVVSVLVNVCKTTLTENLSHYIVDELLDLPRTKDWLFGESIKSTEEEYKEAEMSARGEGILPERIPNRPHAHDLMEYAGVYRHLALGDITVVYEEDPQNEGEGELLFRTQTFEICQMEHYHFEMFKVVLRIFGNAWATSAKFETGLDGKVQGLVLDLLDGKPTLFKRKEEEK